MAVKFLFVVRYLSGKLLIKGYFYGKAVIYFKMCLFICKWSISYSFLDLSY